MTLELSSCYVADVALSFDFKKRRFVAGLIVVSVVNPGKLETAMNIIEPLKTQTGIQYTGDDEAGAISLHIDNGIDPIKLLDYLILKLNGLGCSTAVYDETER